METKTLNIDAALFQELKKVCFARKEVDFNEFIHTILRDYLVEVDSYTPPTNTAQTNKAFEDAFGQNNIFSDLLNNSSNKRNR